MENGLGSEEVDQAVFREWRERTLMAIQQGHLRIQEDEPVLMIGKRSKELLVNFNPKLAQFFEEARSHASLGRPMPDEILAFANRIGKLIPIAKSLAEVARFHNTIGEAIVRSQRPMVLEEAVELTRLVGKEIDATWSTVGKLQHLADKLTRLVSSFGNNIEFLSRKHQSIMEKIKQLYLFDIVLQHKMWRRNVYDVVCMAKDVEIAGFRHNSEGWFMFIDTQFYKVLDVKFNQLLLSVSDGFPTIHVEARCSEGELQYKPPLESLRRSFRMNMNKVINIPASFETVRQKGEFYMPIMTTVRVREAVVILEKHEQSTFARLEQQLQRLKKRKLFDEKFSCDISNERMMQLRDWEQRFADLSQFREYASGFNQDMEVLSSFNVSYQALKNDLLGLVRNYKHVLIRGLTNSIAQDSQALLDLMETFVRNLEENELSQEGLRLNASDSFEKLSNIVHSLVVKAKQELRQKNDLLWECTNSTVDSELVENAWRAFTNLVENKDNHMRQRIDDATSMLRLELDTLKSDIETFVYRWNELKPSDSVAFESPVDIQERIAFVFETKTELGVIIERGHEMNEKCQSLSLSGVSIEELMSIEQDIEPYVHAWGLLEQYLLELAEYWNIEWTLFRSKSYILEEFVEDWKAQAQDISLKNVKHFMMRETEWIQNFMSNMNFLRGDNFSEKHWVELFEILRIPHKRPSDLIAGDFFLSRDALSARIVDVKDLNQRAAGELSIRKAMTEIEILETEMSFDLTEHEDARKTIVPIVQDYKAVVNKLGDGQSLLQSIKSSPFSVSYADIVGVWESKLADLDQCVQKLSKIQRRWIYLEPVFGKGILQTQEQQFMRVDRDFRALMKSISDNNKVFSLLKQKSLKANLDFLVDNLDRCRGSLNAFLEEKRNGFPRFYFLADDDLLEILGQSTKPVVIQAHLKKLFAGIHEVEFDPDFTVIKSMVSPEGEVVPLNAPVKIQAHVEEWLTALSSEMKRTLKSLLINCMSESRSSSVDPRKYPAQILCLSASIIFTEKCEAAIVGSKLPSLLLSLKDTLNRFSLERIQSLDEGNSGLELKLRDLILDAVRQVEVVENLIKRNARSLSDWNWCKQLRFYVKQDGAVVIKMANSEFLYSYEYQGNPQKIVYTSLTNRCFLTLTQGMQLGYGGNPYGPAGTGKTESVKALGGTLGRQVLVFNCDEGIDIKSMQRILTGLLKCGSWGCFDEFNRLDGITLSTLSQLIQPILLGLKNNSSAIKLGEDEVPLDPNTGIFVTLNPAGEGYEGRNKLPDNLKQLFRPIVMKLPDNEKIAQVLLLTEGYHQAAKLGRLIVELFKASEHLLSPQFHYDWGLRCVKSVLKSCESAIKAKRKTNQALSESEEINLVIQSLRLTILPKLTSSDASHFDNLVKDVFKHPAIQDRFDDDLQNALRTAAAALGLKENQELFKKCVELREQLNQRIGVVLLGPSNSGKSTALALLQKALQTLGHVVKFHFLNPKVMPRNQLLGYINHDTRQWTDGILSLKAQQVYAEPHDVISWIVCDGDIDPDWVESLNSVLDDNRLLTLPSGWRIKFGNNVNFIFETHDLSFASPATISRVGMILMGDVAEPNNGLQTDNNDNVPLDLLEGSLLPQTPLIITKDVLDVLRTITPWLLRKESILLTGPKGCGKSMILKHALQTLTLAETIFFQCTSLLSPETVMQKLDDVCVSVTTIDGRAYKGKNADHVILVFEDINFVKGDKWGTCPLIELLRQIVVQKGFYNRNLEWVTLQGFSIVASLTPGISNGKHKITPRFMSRVRICQMDNSSPQLKLDSAPGVVEVSEEQLVELARRGIVTYSRLYRKMDIVLTTEFLQIVSSLDNILSVPGSSVILCGKPGIGRRSALLVVSALQRAEIITPRVGVRYSSKHFQGDLKFAIQKSAIEGAKVFFLVEDFQLLEESFLDMIGTILSSGEVSGLYKREELDALLSGLASRMDSSPSDLKAAFAERVLKYLQFVFITNDENPTVLSNPLLGNLCKKVISHDLGEISLNDLPSQILRQLFSSSQDGGEDLYNRMMENGDNQQSSRFLECFNLIHQSAEDCHHYPRRFTSFVTQFASLYRRYSAELMEQSQRLQAGISKLDESKRLVAVLSGEAQTQEQKLTLKQEEASKAMDMISATLKNSGLQKENLESVRARIEVEKVALAEKKQLIDQDLLEIEPLIETARASVGSIKNEALTEIRSLRAPPEIIRDILEGVLYLMGTRDMSWNSMKNFLSKRGVKDDIRNFDARNVDASDRQAVEKLVKDKAKSFDLNNAKRASAVAAPLAEWVMANMKFASVWEKVEPLEREKKELEEKLKATQINMQEISSGLATVEERVADYTEKYKKASQEEVMLTVELQKVQGALGTATKLVSKLEDEYLRWKEELRENEERIKKLPSEILLGAATVTYLSNASNETRTRCIREWMKITGMKEFNYTKLFLRGRDRLAWREQGLPDDEVSFQNALILFQSELPCYVVDPTSRATDWLFRALNTLPDKQCVTLPMNDPKFETELELAIRFGKVFLITEADSLKPVLVPILRKQFLMVEGRSVMPVGEKMVDYNPSLKLFFATRNPTPSVPVDVSTCLNFVNFTVTRAGLSSQLLATTLAVECPEMQEQSEQLLNKMESLKVEVNDSREFLLSSLLKTQGDILQNSELLETLDKAKAHALEVQQSLEQSSDLETTIRKETDVYRSFTDFGSHLFFVVNSLKVLNSVYQFSLSSFNKLFKNTLLDVSKSRLPDQRIAVLQQRLLETVYNFVYQALQREDRMCFIVHVAKEMFPENINAEEWEFFTQPGSSTTGRQGRTPKIPDWVPDEHQATVTTLLTKCPQLNQVLDLQRFDSWKTFLRRLEDNSFAADLRLSHFQKLLLCSLFKADGLYSAMYDFGRRSLDRKSLYPPVENLQRVAADVHPGEPILVLISPGADPSEEIRCAAIQSVGLERYVEISLGEGDLINVISRIHSYSSEGFWICIKNLHLVLKVLDMLEKGLRSLQPSQSSRVWLTSETHPDFPASLAQLCHKVAYEAPQGVKNNMLRSLSSWTPSFFSQLNSLTRCKTLFSLCLFHALLQERRTYNPQGWNRFYEFNDCDFRTGADVIEQLHKMDGAERIQWAFVRGLFVEATYGGRVEDIYDFRILTTYVNEIFNEDAIRETNHNLRVGSIDLRLPSSTNLSEYLSAIESLPEVDGPSIFGLPENVDKAWQKQKGLHVIHQLKSISSVQSIIEEGSTFGETLTAVCVTWKNSTTATYLFNMYPIKTDEFDASKLPKADPSNCISAFVFLENHNLTLLLRTIHLSLGAISKMIRLKTRLSSDLLPVAEKLSVNEVPQSWRSIWDGPQNASEYLALLVKKAVNFHEHWFSKARSGGDLLNRRICLSDFLNPGAFLSAFKQHSAKSLNVGFDELDLHCVWSNKSPKPESSPCCILTGILVEGCTLHDGRMQECQPDALVHSPAPDCLMWWEGSGQNEERSQLFVPVYTNEFRRKVIAELPVPAKDTAEKWIKASVAFILIK